jgi:hypothetical protein
MKHNYHTMGRSKQLESDALFDTLRQAKRRKSVVPATGGQYANQDAVDIADVLQFVKMRIWRTSLAMLLCLHSMTKGFFRKNGLVKLGALSLIAYGLLFSNTMVEHRRQFFSSSSGGKAAKTSLSMLNDAAGTRVHRAVRTSGHCRDEAIWHTSQH